jgi:hypothetical protein
MSEMIWVMHNICNHYGWMEQTQDMSPALPTVYKGGKHGRVIGVEIVSERLKIVKPISDDNARNSNICLMIDTIDLTSRSLDPKALNELVLSVIISTF